LYKAAFAALSVPVRVVDADEAALLGLSLASAVLNGGKGIV
jgi:hypothetical protein